jgi:hypothetical protein
MIIQHANIDRAKAQVKRLRSMGIEVDRIISYSRIDRRDVHVDYKYRVQAIKTKGHGIIIE